MISFAVRIVITDQYHLSLRRGLLLSDQYPRCHVSWHDAAWRGVMSHDNVTYVMRCVTQHDGDTGHQESNEQFCRLITRHYQYPRPNCVTKTLQLSHNKTKYFRLRLYYEVSWEWPKSYLREIWARKMKIESSRQVRTGRMNERANEQTNAYCDSLSSWRSQKFIFTYL